MYGKALSLEKGVVSREKLGYNFFWKVGSLTETHPYHARRSRQMSHRAKRGGRGAGDTG